MEWFRRFGDIPGIDYQVDPQVDRSRLAHKDDVPRVASNYLMWPTDEGSTSASPAHRHWHSDNTPVPNPELLLNMMEALELPGIPSDYHFIIQGCAERLWARRREEPSALESVERLCWLDIRLIEVKPSLIHAELRGARVMTFQWLIDLRAREGFLNEALDIARLAATFQQGDTNAQLLQDRIAALEAEVVTFDR